MSKCFKCISLLLIASLMIFLASCDDKKTGSTTPSAPTGLTATSDDSSITVSWGSVPGATSYKVYRSSSNDGNYQEIGHPSGTSHVDGKPLSGSNYYKVKAVNADGESGFSNYVSCDFEGEGNDDDGFVIDAKNVIGGNNGIAEVIAVVMDDEGDFWDIADAPYKNNGFKITLPETLPNDVLWPAYELDCIDDLIDNLNAQTTILFLVAFDHTGEGIGVFILGNADIEVQPLYADKNFTIKGYDCDDWQWDCSVSKSWNMLYYDYEIGKITTTKPAGATLDWYYLDWDEVGKKAPAKSFNKQSIKMQKPSKPVKR